MKAFVKIKQFKIIIIPLFLAITFFGAGNPKERRFDSAIQDGRAGLVEFLKVSRIPGLSVAVAFQGKIIWSQAFGYADLEQQVPVTTRTRFRLGSVSKIFTAAAVARLVQEGKLDLDASIQRYVANFPDKGSAITTRQLSGHLAGIRHYQPKDLVHQIDFQHYNTIQDSLKIFQDDPLLAPPGTAYAYSTFGYTLISRIVEQASGQDFLQYMQAGIFQPMGLKNTTADITEMIVPTRSRFYDRTSTGEVRNAAYVDSSYKWAGGGFLSTAEDLVLFGSKHLQPGFFKQETLNVLFSSQQTTDGKPTGVGMGWRIAEDHQKRRVFHHAGSIKGGRSVLVLYPDSGLVVALLSNLGETPPAVEQTALTLAAPFLEIEEKPSDKGKNFSGDYDYVVESTGLSNTGKISLRFSKGSYSGWMTTPKSLSEFARRTGLPVLDRVTIVSGKSVNEKGQFAVASPAGLFLLELHRSNGQISGTITCPLGPKPAETKMRITPEPGR